LAAGGATNINFQLAQVTSGAGTSTQTTNVLGYFQAVGNGYASYQYAPLTNSSGPVVLNLGGVETLQVSGDGFEHVNYFMLASALPNAVPINATISGGNVNLSFLTQSGYTYTIYYKTNLSDTAWTQLTGGGNPVTGNGLTQTITDNPNQGHRFYRLSIQ
jgi:hypothetical protein